VTDQTPQPPSRRDRFRPLELLVLSAIIAVFVGLVVAASIRNWETGAIFGGIAFIVALVVLATLAITTRPDVEERKDIDDQNQHRPHA
jgi:F0F1-type ATP synthase assembly protein I